MKGLAVVSGTCRIVVHHEPFVCCGTIGSMLTERVCMRGLYTQPGGISIIVQTASRQGDKATYTAFDAVRLTRKATSQVPGWWWHSIVDICTHPTV